MPRPMRARSINEIIAVQFDFRQQIQPMCCEYIRCRYSLVVLLEESIRIGCFNSVLSSHGICLREKNSPGFPDKNIPKITKRLLHSYDLPRREFGELQTIRSTCPFSSSSAQPIEVLLVILIRTSGIFLMEFLEVMN